MLCFWYKIMKRRKIEKLPPREIEDESVDILLDVLGGKRCFVDIGCGYGNILERAVKHGYKNIIGIEIEKQYYEKIIKNLNRKYKFEHKKNNTYYDSTQDCTLTIINDDIRNITTENPGPFKNDVKYDVYWYGPIWNIDIKSHICKVIGNMIKKNSRKVYVTTIDAHEYNESEECWEYGLDDTQWSYIGPCKYLKTPAGEFMDAYFYMKTTNKKEIGIEKTKLKKKNSNICKTK